MRLVEGAYMAKETTEAKSEIISQDNENKIVYYTGNVQDISALLGIYISQGFTPREYVEPKEEKKSRKPRKDKGIDVEYIRSLITSKHPELLPQFEDYFTDKYTGSPQCPPMGRARKFVKDFNINLYE